MGDITITVEPQQTGPCGDCGKSACFCPLCLKVKAGNRLCGKCYRKSKEEKKP